MNDTSERAKETPQERAAKQARCRDFNRQPHIAALLTELDTCRRRAVTIEREIMRAQREAGL